MQKLLLVIPVLALTLLCACSSGKTPAVAADIASASVSENTEAPAPDQEPDAVPVSGSLPDITPPPQKSESEAPPEPEPDRVQEVGEASSLPDDGRSPDRVLTSANYTVEVYTSTAEQDGGQIESREYRVSDGVTASTYRATGVGDCSFFDQTVTEPGVAR